MFATGHRGFLRFQVVRNCKACPFVTQDTLITPNPFLIRPGRTGKRHTVFSSDPFHPDT